jgi:hypothetical protein
MFDGIKNFQRCPQRCPVPGHIIRRKQTVIKSCLTSPSPLHPAPEPRPGPARRAVPGRRRERGGPGRAEGPGGRRPSLQMPGVFRRPPRSDCHVRTTSQNPAEARDASGRPRRGWARGQTSRPTCSPGAPFCDAPAGAGACPAGPREAESSGGGGARAALTPPPPGRSRAGLGGVSRGLLGQALLAGARTETRAAAPPRVGRGPPWRRATTSRARVSRGWAAGGTGAPGPARPPLAAAPRYRALR